ncbi:RNA-binding protein NOB1 [Tribolium castaneum]|uniref:RNA-binding protein NOB1 n=1 Tax=Tribolium castaneum TaxID=7070 RepID=D6WLV0_TRICA|nr:PREDICTED: RNA-binding protein NOB1 [Tribolium castaneum]EFA03398.1 RNA-binding protein NOB1-like Protein [Tribolium castaneum]|eukprot:XP_974124.1 PREDICTED: RNA-binding protein NOB1 [Tribolium castaneum]
MGAGDKKIECLVVDTTAFIQNAPLQDVAEKMVTCQSVVDEILNKRQLKRLVVLPYDLQVKEVFPENIKIVTEFAKKTGDYPSLSATDIQVMALTYQLEKEAVGVEHLRTEPVFQRTVTTTGPTVDLHPDVTGFFLPGHTKIKDRPGETNEETDEIEKLQQKFETIECADEETSEDHDVLVPVDDASDISGSNSDEDDDDDSGWITPSNVSQAKKQVNSQLIEEKHVKIACMTTDFAMQNVLKQMNLNVAALDGRMIKQLRTYILRCYACFKTTSIMTKKFCPKCGLNTLKKVAVSLNEDGKLQIHINAKRPLTARGKKFSLPRMKGGKHPNNPILAEDHPMPQNRASKLARTKINPLDDDYIAGFSPFAVRDVTSRSAQLGIRPGQEMKYWMRKNPNEARRRRK